MTQTVISSAAYVLAHVPDLVQYGSKPSREIRVHAPLRQELRKRLRCFPEVINYPPNQTFIGNLSPEALAKIERPWHVAPLADAQRTALHGELMPEDELYGLLKVVDRFELVSLTPDFQDRVAQSFSAHALGDVFHFETVKKTRSWESVEKKITNGEAIAFSLDGTVVGCIERGHEEDESQTAGVLLENLACKATAYLALAHLLRDENPLSIDYVINAGEEAVGDRYQRGAGNLAKAVAEQAGCLNATGADVKAFCCGPVHAVVIAASLVRAGVFRRVAVIGGGSLAKLGMKFLGHIRANMPVLEDTLAGMALLIEADDSRSPRIRLDAIGRHSVQAGATPVDMVKALVSEPLSRISRSVCDIDRYAVELHNPDITEPAGSGNVPYTNYRTLAALAAIRGEIRRTELDAFIEAHGLPGFSPTQGHIPSALPYVGHALEAMREGRISSAMFIGKGSLFLGKMTQLSDGMSFVLEAN